jgi:mannose-1-phosphate guanylyltransferase
MKITALIMAGGKGERFWPRSRVNCPKQFIDISGCGKTMIQLTVDRILPMVKEEDIYIATNENYKSLVMEQLPEIPEENILCEPIGRNTAPCVGLGAVYMLKKNEDAVMMVLASDHLIKYEDIFRNVLKEAVNIAEKGNNIVTIGISPDCPETGYGYIKKNRAVTMGNANAVECFVEKPDRETAIAYLNSGDYLWNSGMFVWKASTVMDSMEKYMPDIYEGLKKIGESIGTSEEQSVLREEFTAMRSESVDYGIMEKAQDIYVLPGQFGWDDVGSWLAVGRIKLSDENENVFTGNVVAANTKNCIIEAKDKLIAAVGLDNIVVVDTEDVTLIGDKVHMGEIKQILSMLRERGDGGRYL